MKVAAVVLRIITIAAISTVIRDAVLGIDSGRRGWLLRALPCLPSCPQ
jgi:hypothetical protein